MQASCPTGKSCYQTWSQANHRARAMNSRKGIGDSVLPYRCRICGHWHLGSQNPQVRQQKRDYRRRKIIAAVRAADADTRHAHEVLRRIEAAEREIG